VHTAPVYISINNKPVRASSSDATYFVKWIDNILEKIGPGGAWNRYFTKDRQVVTARYKKARDIYKKVATESDHAPILLINSKENFGNYTAEMLRAEGISSFVTETVGDTMVPLKDLRRRKIVILSSQNVSQAQASVFEQYVKEGGRLIATMPVNQLDRTFGITRASHVSNYNYIVVNKSSSLAKGITSKPMPLHTKIFDYKLNSSAKSVANFYPPGSSPAIVFNNYGKGQSLSFLYNLPESVVLTRQGNPADAGKEMDSIPGLRAMDLFTNGWVDTSCNKLNHADEQMHILSRAVEKMSDIPVPRLWYFPDTLKCVVTLNNDGEDSKENEFEPQFNDVYAKGARMTLYIKEVDFVSKKWTDKWRSRGFEMSGHPDQTKFAANPSWQRMDTIYDTLNGKLKSSLGIPPMETVTNHWFVWPGNYENGKTDFAAQAKLEEQHGVGLDCNYAHYDNNARRKQFLGSYGYTQGNYTGSGLPMKFADTDGSIINVYQQLNNVYDQQYMEHNDKDGYFNAFRGLMDRSIDSGVYSYISVRSHNNEYFFSKVPLMKMLDYANAKHIPVWTELQLLQFLRARENAGFSDVKFYNNQLTFKLSSSYAADIKLTAMVPTSFNGKKIIKVFVDGVEFAYSSFVVRGDSYAFVPVDAGVTSEVVVEYK
jgi:hypothetical protein